MWTADNRPRYNRDKLRYPSDLTDAEWAHIEPLIPPGKPGGGKRRVAIREVINGVNGGAKLVHPGGAKLVHLMLCGTRCWGVVPVVHRRDPRCFVSRLRYAERSSVGGSCGPTGSTIAPAVKQVFLGISAVFGFG